MFFILFFTLKHHFYLLFQEIVVLPDVTILLQDTPLKARLLDSHQLTDYQRIEQLLAMDSLQRPPLPTFEFAAEIDGTGLCYEEFMPLGDEDPLDPDYMDSTIEIKSQA